MSRLAWILALVFWGGSTFALHSHLDEVEAEITAKEGWRSPPSLTTLKVTSVGYEHMAADFMWLQALQYFGAHKQNREDGHFRLLVPFIKTVVGLDPAFEYAYRFGGVSAVGPRGENVELANELLELGYLNRPDSWRIPYQKASNCLQFRQDDRACIATGFRRAAQIEGAPSWMDLLASRALASNREEGLARDLIYRALEKTNDPLLRGRLQDRLVDLEISESLHRIAVAVEAWRQAGGKGCPNSLEALASHGIDPKEEPPTGGRYFLDSDCRPEATSRVGSLELHR